MRTTAAIAAAAALVAGLASRAPAQQNCGPCGSDFVAYETGEKVGINTVFTVTTPFTSGTVDLTKSHRLLVPAGINGQSPANPGVHYFGVEAEKGTYDTNTTPDRMFSTSLGTVTFKPGTIKFFYDPTSKAPVPGNPGPPPTADPLLCFAARTGSKGPKPDIATTDQFGTQHPSLMGIAYACVASSISGPAPAESWIVCFSQRTRDAIKPPDVNLNTLDLGSFSNMDLDPLDEVCLQATVQ